MSDTSLLSHVSDKSTSQNELNKYFQAISNWASQWKIQINPDPNKQAQQVHFSKKANVSLDHRTFKNTKFVTCSSSQKHLGLALEQHRNFNDNIQFKMTKCYKMIGIINRLSVNISHDALLWIYISFIRPQLGYQDLFQKVRHGCDFSGKGQENNEKAQNIRKFE